MRRFVALMAAALVAAAIASPAGAALPPGGTFLDDDFSFAQGWIEAIAAAGLTAGCDAGLFCPERPVTRAETAVFLVRALGDESEAAKGVYPDVAADAWYAAAVEHLSGLGIVGGDPDGRFRPGDPLSRAEMAVVLARTLGHRLGVTPSVPSVFVDVPVDAWYSADAELVRARGVTAGCATGPMRFCPTEPVTRAQMAVFVGRVLDLDPLEVPVRLAPLTGTPVGGVEAMRRVVAVKVDNARLARPQSGIEHADAMVETLVEGGLTRWIALFHQSDIGYVGPVRSGRPTDTGLLFPLRATMVASGAQPWILDTIAAGGVPVIRERDVEPPALYRIAERVAPYNLYADTSALRTAADQLGYPDGPPPSWFERGELPTDGISSDHITLQWSDPIAVTWTWDGSRYRRWMYGAPHLTVGADGSTEQITSDVVVVLVAPVYDVSPPPGVSGSPVPALDTVGEGDLYVYARGRLIRGMWRRASINEWFGFATVDGDPLVIPPGRMWLNVFPDGQPIRS